MLGNQTILNSIKSLYASQELVVTSIRLLVAALCGSLIGMEREKRFRPAGARTHMLVCVASALVMLINWRFCQMGYPGDPTRMGAQVVSGIGFLGAGTILIDRQNRVRGLTTAAGLWASACVGLAIGAGYYAGAIVACMLILIIFIKFIVVEQYFVHRGKEIGVYIEFENAKNLNLFLEQVVGMNYKIISFELVPSKNFHENISTVAAHLGIRMPKTRALAEMMLLFQNSEGMKGLEEL